MSNLAFQSFTAGKKKEPQYTWYDSTTWKPMSIPFTGTPGPRHEAAELQSAEPADFASLYLTDELLTQICHNTNRNAEQTIESTPELSLHSRLRAWKTLEVPELKKFLGLLLLTGKFLSPVE